MKRYSVEGKKPEFNFPTIPLTKKGKYIRDKENKKKQIIYLKYTKNILEEVETDHRSNKIR